MVILKKIKQYTATAILKQLVKSLILGGEPTFLLVPIYSIQEMQKRTKCCRRICAK